MHSVAPLSVFREQPVKFRFGKRAQPPCARLSGLVKTSNASKLWTTIKEPTMRTVPYPTPGEILLEEFLKPMSISQYRLAKEIGVSQRRIGEIVAGNRAVTVDTGLRLSRYFGTSDEF